MHLIAAGAGGDPRTALGVVEKQQHQKPAGRRVTHSA